MILLIDNYDSFVYNLARYVGELGFSYEVFRNDVISLPDIIELNPSHIILSPGPCSPNEAGICLELIQALYKTMPLLGVCLGHQAIAQAFGGIITRAKQPMHGRSSLIQHNGSGVFQGLPNPLKVGRYHSLAVSLENLPTCLIKTAMTDDGEIMALEHQNYPVVGLQFHPESVLTQYGHRLLENFLKNSNLC